MIGDHLEELDAAERRVTEVYFAWRRGEPTEVDAELNAMLEHWRQVGNGEELVLEWSAARPAGRRGHRSRGFEGAGGSR